MRQKGFSLIELLVVVAIILIIAAIAVPNLLTAKISANEAAAVSTIRSIDTAQVSYNTAYPEIGYAGELSSLGMSTDGVISKEHGGYLDWLIGCASQPCKKSGYMFSVSSTGGLPATSFTSSAQPTQVGVTGRRGFCGDRLVITFDPQGGASCTATLQ